LAAALARRAGHERARRGALPAAPARPLPLDRPGARRLQRRSDGRREGWARPDERDRQLRRQRDAALAYPERLLVRIALLALAAAALAVPAAAPAAPSAGCTTAKRPAAKPNGGHKAPKSPLPAGHIYSATFVTNCGAFTVQLAAKTSPRTVASFVALARSGFFDKPI